MSGASGVSFTISTPDLTTTGGFPTGAELCAAGWNTTTSQWENLGGSTGAASNAAGTLLSGSVSDMSAYSAIGIASVSSIAPLPIGLLTFSAKLITDHDALLNWSVANAKAGKDYIVERSGDGSRFNAIGTVPATASEAYSLHDY